MNTTERNLIYRDLNERENEDTRKCAVPDCLFGAILHYEHEPDGAIYAVSSGEAPYGPHLGDEGHLVCGPCPKCGYEVDHCPQAEGGPDAK